MTQGSSGGSSRCNAKLHHDVFGDILMIGSIQNWIRVHRRELLALVILGSLWLWSQTPDGFHYLPFRDDWTWFGRPNFLHETRWQTYIGYGLDSYRPLSFLFDTEVASRLWPHLWPISLLMTIMTFATALVYRQIVRELWDMPGWLMAIVMLWWPLEVEGQYWLAAAVGAVPAMFFMGMGIWGVLRVQSGRLRPYWLIGAAAAFLVSDLCYEQQWFLSVGVVILLAIKHRHAWWKYALVPIVPLAMTGVWYLTHYSGLVQNGKVESFSLGAIAHSLTLIAPQVGSLFGPATITAWRQALFTWNRMGLLAALLSAVLVAAWLIFAKKASATRTPRQESHPSWGILVLLGVLWIVTAYLPWVVTKYDWVADRSLYAASPGIALILGGLWHATSHGWAHRSRALRSVTWIVAGILLFSLINLRRQDISAYVASNQFDIKIGQLVLHRIETLSLTSQDTLLIRTDTNTFVPWDNFYHDHVASSWQVNWGAQLLLYSESHGQFFFNNAVEVWPSISPAAIKTRALGVVLTDHQPSPRYRHLMGSVPTLVIQYRDTWPKPAIVATRFYQ